MEKMMQMMQEALREVRNNQIELDHRLRQMENQVHTLRENEISRRVGDNERAINTITASYKTTRLWFGAALALLTLIFSFLQNPSCGAVQRASLGKGQVQSSSGSTPSPPSRRSP